MPHVWHNRAMVSNGANLTHAQEALAADMAEHSAPLTPAGFMTMVGRHVRHLNLAFQVPPPQAEMVEAGVLQNSFPAFLLLQRREPGRASQWVVHTWQDYAVEAERLPEDPDKHAVLDYDRAVFEYLSAADRETEGRRILGRLMSRLGIGQDEAGRMFGVSGETIRRWERGQIRIPHARMAELVSFDAALVRLESLFLSERLPQVIRRRADLFENERALDLILRGRIAQVAERYETALAYQA